MRSVKLFIIIIAKELKITTYRQDLQSPPLVQVSIFPANKGLNSAMPSALLKHEELNQSRNIIHTTNGSRRTRPGIDPFYISGFGGDGSVVGLLDHWYNTGATNKIQNTMAIVNDPVLGAAVYSSIGATGIFERVSDSTSIPPGFFVGTPFSTMDALVELVLIGLVNQGYFTFNPATKVWTKITTPGTDEWIVRKHRSCVYLAGSTQFKDVLIKSDTENPIVFSGGSSDSFNLDLGASDPFGILTLSPTIFGRMYIGKFNSIYELQTFSGGQLINPLIEGIGMISHNATVATQNDLIFPSARGLHSLQTTQNYGDVDTTFISFPIHDIWENTVDFNNPQYMSACFVPEYNSYLITYPERNSTNFSLIGYNIATGDIFYWQGFNATFLSTIKDSNKRTRLLIGTNDANIGLGRVMTDTEFTDFLNSFASGFRTGQIFPTYQPGTSWNFKNLTVFFKPLGGNPFSVAYKIDNKDIETLDFDQTSGGAVNLIDFTLGQDLLGAENTYSRASKSLKGYGNSIQLDFNATDGGMEIYGYEIECEQSGDTFKPVTTA